MNGILILDKPAGITSAQAVARVRRLLPPGTKVGHAGTLDPFATGLLIVLVGRATRLAEQFMSQVKEYVATIKLGFTTPTLDPESPEIPVPPPGPIAHTDVQGVLTRFVGWVRQTPPAYSAVKIRGVPAYELARRGKAPELHPRAVRIDSIDVLDYSWPLLKLRIRCGRGTYIRALARDIGQALASGGYVTALCRTCLGCYRIEQAATLDQLVRDGIARWLQPETSIASGKT